MSDFNPGVIEKNKHELKEPPKYKVVFHNDDYTPFEFVAMIVKKVFRKTNEETAQFVQQVHKNGKGIAGVYSYDIANTRAANSVAIARENGYPLKVTIEEA